MGAAYGLPLVSNTDAASATCAPAVPGHLHDSSEVPVVLQPFYTTYATNIMLLLTMARRSWATTSTCLRCSVNLKRKTLCRAS